MHELRVPYRSEAALPTRQGGTLLGIGTAPGWRETAEAYMAIAEWPWGLNWSGSLHWRNLPGWIEARRNSGFGGPGVVCSCGTEMRELVDVSFNPWNLPVGSSGFLPVVVGHVLQGADRIVLAGVVLGERYERYRRCWRKAAEAGWTENVYMLQPGPLVEEGVVPLWSGEQ
jgi:hypothetical protein